MCVNATYQVQEYQVSSKLYSIHTYSLSGHDSRRLPRFCKPPTLALFLIYLQYVCSNVVMYCMSIHSPPLAAYCKPPLTRL